MDCDWKKVITTSNARLASSCDGGELGGETDDGLGGGAMVEGLMEF